MFQNSVGDDLAWGIPGEFALAGDVRAEPVALSEDFIASDNATAPFGLAVTAVAGESGVVEFGGEGQFVGIIVNPKAAVMHASVGSTEINFASGTQLEAASQSPGVFVLFPVPANIGDGVAYYAGGILAPAPAQVAPDDTTLIPGARVVRYNTTSGMAIISLQQLPAPAVTAPA